MSLRTAATAAAAAVEIAAEAGVAITVKMVWYGKTMVWYGKTMVWYGMVWLNYGMAW